MGKRQPKETIIQNAPSDPGKPLSDSSDVDAASNVGEDGAHARSTPRAGSPMQVELEPEDSVTCQWEDCGVVFTHLPTLIDHIHNGAKSQGSVSMSVVYFQRQTILAYISQTTHASGHPAFVEA
jgi:hypothetical protein